MAKPALIIEKHGVLFVGCCSFCPKDQFNALMPGNAPDYEVQLNKSFRVHCAQAHTKEDLNRAAARIVREATRD